MAYPGPGDVGAVPGERVLVRGRRVKQERRTREEVGDARQQPLVPHVRDRRPVVVVVVTADVGVVGVVGQDGVERRAVEEVLRPVPARDSEPRGPDAGRQEREAAVRGDQQITCFQQGDLVPQPNVVAVREIVARGQDPGQAVVVVPGRGEMPVAATAAGSGQVEAGAREPLP